MKKIILFFTIIVNIFAFNWYGNIHWAKSETNAFNSARKNHKLILIDISGIHCPPSKYMSKYVYTDPKIADYTNNHFVSLFYFAQKSPVPKEIKKYFKGTTPTFIFLKPNGKFFYKLTGGRNPSNFLKVLKKLNKQYKNNFKKAVVNSPKPMWLQIPKK